MSALLWLANGLLWLTQGLGGTVLLVGLLGLLRLELPRGRSAVYWIAAGLLITFLRGILRAAVKP